MKTIQQLIAENPAADDTQIVSLYNTQPPEPKPSDTAGTYATYLSIGELPAPFDGNTAGKMRSGLLAWCIAIDLSTLNAALPNPGQLQAIHDRLAGYPGVDFSSSQAPALLQLFAAGVDPTHPPLLTADQAAALLSVGYNTVAPIAESDVAAQRAFTASESRRMKLMIALNAVSAAFSEQPTATTAALAAVFTSTMDAA